MKHLKLYEELGNGFYEKVHYTEAVRLISNHDSVMVDSKEVGLLTSISGFRFVGPTLEDEYFLINCAFSKRSEADYIKYKKSMNHRSNLMVDGRENLLPVIKDMIQNYDLLS